MIKQFNIILIAISLLIIQSGFSQNLGNCSTVENFSNSYELSEQVGCTYMSIDYLDKYRTPQYWIPNNTTPTKTILVNYIICQKDDGTGGWVDSEALRNQIDLMFDSINYRYSHSLIKGYSLTCEPNINYITDTKIRFELNEIIFIQNTQFYELGRYSNMDNFFNYLFTYYPNAKNVLNHIFTMPTGSQGGTWGHYTVWNNNTSYVHTWGSMYSDWYVVWHDHINHISHEYGHSLGLHHTYNGEITQINHYDFLDDVFGTCAEPSLQNPAMQDPTNPCYGETPTKRRLHLRFFLSKRIAFLL